ncbi:Ubiquitin-protein ligase [Lasiodiplodia theobromae]|uniref:Ubiquitin-protein ligase n=1 Tax=Lasiodiplodia theobromae TaxID=45133 RepID=A0A5N5DAU5_9PEZI|nr:Ubiquitin-protein ligase [Lasiodiplodia theobromae]
MPPPNNPLLAPREIIEILSDDESDDDLMEIAPPPQRTAFADVPTPAANAEFDAEWAAIMAVVEGEETAHEPIAEQPHPMTEDEFLSRVLEIYPDISHDHVRAMFRGGLDVGMLPDSTWCDQLIVRILDEGKYPTEREAKRAALKRKREPSDDDFERAPMDSGHFATRRAYQNAAVNTLQNHYREIPVAFIQQVLKEQGSFYKAFLRLEELDRTYSTMDPFRRPYRKVRIRDTRPLHSTASQESHVTEAMQTIAKESQAAKKKVGQDAVTRQHEEQKRLEEERNAAQARSLGEESECMSCFDTGPTNRMMFCDGANIHYLCQDCARNCVNAELDAGRCRPKCCDPTCGADFSNAQLKAFIDPKVFCRMEKLQQQDDLRKAGIENLVQCPFCDFQAECEPVEVDREFRCQNADCEIVSCRLCRLESHVPLTCEEAGKERSGNVRHHIEEAMTKALVRTCNGCKMPFMKSDGCNKMTCASCHHTQCYICSKSVTGYEHFHNSHGKCPLYDENVEKRHVDEVKAAEAKALEEVKKANPDLTDEELKIKLSDVVQKEEKKRLAAADRRQQHHGPFRAFRPGDPIAVPAAGGRRAQNAMVLDALVEPMLGMPPRWMGAPIPEIPDFEAFNPAPNQRQVNNPQQADIDAARANGLGLAPAIELNNRRILDGLTREESITLEVERLDCLGSAFAVSESGNGRLRLQPQLARGPLQLKRIKNFTTGLVSWPIQWMMRLIGK